MPQAPKLLSCSTPHYQIVWQKLAKELESFKLKKRYTKGWPAQEFTLVWSQNLLVWVRIVSTTLLLALRSIPKKCVKNVRFWSTREAARLSWRCHQMYTNDNEKKSSRIKRKYPWKQNNFRSWWYWNLDIKQNKCVKTFWNWSQRSNLHRFSDKI